MGKAVYCGCFSCQKRECKYHMSQIERADIPNDYLNLKGSPLCPLERKDDENKVSADSH